MEGHSPGKWKAQAGFIHDLGAVRSFGNTKDSSRPYPTNSNTILWISDINGISTTKHNRAPT